MVRSLGLVLAALLFSICSSLLGSAACLTTLAPNPPFTPPEPYRATVSADTFWYGTEALWTLLPVNGTWRGLPRNDRGYSQKVFWWRQGYDRRTEQKPKLILTGRRLDGDAPSIAVSDATNAYEASIGSAMLIGVVIPTEGCWEITGHYGGRTLTFIVLVEP